MRGSSSATNYTITGLSPGTTYYVSVTAKKAQGESEHSSQIRAETLPSAPSELTKGTVTSNSVNLTWIGVTGATTYIVYASPRVSTMIPLGYTYSTNCTLYINPNTVYYAAVSTENSRGESELSPVISVQTKLSMPSGVTAAPVSGTNTIQISWNTLDGAVSYKIYRSTNETSGYSLIGTTSGTSYNDTGCTQSTTYYYKVNATGSNGEEGDLSPPSSATITTANNDISSFKFRNFTAGGDINADINGTNITVTVPSIVNLTGLVPTIDHNGASVAPAAGTPQDFTSPLTYTVTAENGGIKYYTVTVTVADDSLSSALIWLGNNAKTSGKYTIVPKRDEAISPTALSYNNKSAEITLKGNNSERVIRLSSYGSLFTIGSSVTLILDNNITLQEDSGNTTSLVKLDASSARLVMNAGSNITGNTTATDGGGVYAGAGDFTMNGGTISNNYISNAYGGGVSVYNGTFTKTGGSVSSNTLTASLKTGAQAYASIGSTTLKRDTAAGTGVNLDTTRTGSIGGWE